MEDPDGGSGWMRWMRMRDIGRTADGVRTHMDYLDPLHNSPYGAIIIIVESVRGINVIIIVIVVRVGCGSRFKQYVTLS